MGLSLESRTRQTIAMCKRYPDKVPIMLSSDRNSSNQSCVSKKLMIPRSATCAQFIVMIRERVQIQSTHALFFVTVPKHHLICGSTTIGEVYDKEKTDDGFLYIVYALEHSFGASGKNGNCSTSAHRYERSVFLYNGGSATGSVSSIAVVAATAAVATIS